MPDREELLADEVYERARSFLDRLSLKDITGFGNPPTLKLPLQRVLYRQIGSAMRAMEAAAREKHDLMAKLAVQERFLATAREELGAMLDAWPAEAVVAA
ncbi:MAG: hypothetical protein E5W82_10635 [Mesorhizobium sp.]|nr:MAG: hypothetical protein E5W82_10635 [Mesorhizobium sp.]